MELRKDYVLDRWVILSEGRGKRPHEFKHKVKKKEKKICFFCPGNEKLTPHEIGRVEEDGKWIIRWFPNKFPAVREEGDPIIKTDNTYFTFAAAFGEHEVIAETNDHEKQLWDMPKEHIKKLLDVYKKRIIALSEESKYVILFKNHGKDAGTSLVHSHTQIASFNKVPVEVQQKVEACKKFDHCPYCDIINVEKGSFRRVFENNTFVCFTPYASRFNYEIWFFPKRHVRNLIDLSEEETFDLADLMQRVLAKLKEIDASYNYFLHYAPGGEDLHFHIELTPRLAKWAGFEFCSGTTINSVTPENAAKFYRGEE